MNAAAVWVMAIGAAGLFVAAYFLLRRSRTAPEPKAEMDLAVRVQWETYRAENQAVIDRFFAGRDLFDDVAVILTDWEPPIGDQVEAWLRGETNRRAK